MAKRTHISVKGETVNFDELASRNEEVIAIGNASMNARGDKISPQGKIIRKVSDIPEALRADPNAAYNTTNPKAVKLASIKGSVDDFLASNAVGNPNLAETFTEDELTGKGAKTPQEAMNDFTKKARSDAKKLQSNRKIVDSDE